MISKTISKNEAGQRLDKYLHKLLPLAPTSFFYKMLRKKNIVLNGKKAEGNEKLNIDDIVSFYLSDETFSSFQSKELGNTVIEYQKAFSKLKGIQVLFENEHMLLLNKPAGILSQKAQKQDLSLNEWMIGYLLNEKVVTENTLSTFKPSVLNRLDRNTSGIVICAKTLLGSQELSEWIRTRKVRKYYRLFVKGRVANREQHILGYLKKDEKTNKVEIYQKPVPDSSRIETFYKPINIGEELTYLEVELITGKTHQIRAHMASIGHPVLFDPKYGDLGLNKKFSYLGNDSGQLLHAYRLEFPKGCKVLDEKPMVFIAEEPPVFHKILEH